MTDACLVEQETEPIPAYVDVINNICQRYDFPAGAALLMQPTSLTQGPDVGSHEAGSVKRFSSLES